MKSSIGAAISEGTVDARLKLLFDDPRDEVESHDKRVLFSEGFMRYDRTEDLV